MSESAYSMFLRTSVVITTIGASPLMVVSPVSSPTLEAPYFADSSENFWLLSALIGVV
ncbi:hypothetical protein AHiyo8_64020 [Arthrobacter sp. Hiyo8]|nr:hypothetical protein AHiyo8_64020 [Arthrobacter sp. Hiyo8]